MSNNSIDNKNTFGKYYLTSGIGLKTFLEDCGLMIIGATALEGSDNVIKLPDLTTFNWKKAQGIVRVNCKEKAMKIIEVETNLKHIDNGKGDSLTRPYSFIISNLAELIDIIAAIKKIDGNRKL